MATSETGPVIKPTRREVMAQVLRHYSEQLQQANKPRQAQYNRLQHQIEQLKEERRGLCKTLVKKLNAKKEHSRKIASLKKQLGKDIEVGSTYEDKPYEPTGSIKTATYKATSHVNIITRATAKLPPRVFQIDAEIRKLQQQLGEIGNEIHDTRRRADNLGRQDLVTIVGGKLPKAAGEHLDALSAMIAEILDKAA